MDALKSILGEGVSDDILAGLLRKYGDDVAAAANAFFDGGPAAAAPAPPPPPPQNGGCCNLGDDVMTTLFRTLEEVRQKLTERDQQLDLTTRLVEVLTRRLQEVERELARADANLGERAEADAAAALSLIHI